MAKATAPALEALKIENRFLSGVRANIEESKGEHLRGSIWQTVADDDSDALRALMASKRMYDRNLLKEMPQNRRVAVSGYERRFLFWRKQTGTAIASVLSPFEDLLAGQTPPPIGINVLTEHLRKIAPDPKARYVVGVCAPTGFTDEARSARHDQGHLTVVLVEPAAGGGWRVTAGDDVPDFVRKMFDPEDADEKVDRVRSEIERCGADLLTGGLSAQRIADRLHLSEEVVVAALEQVAKEDPELRLSRASGDRLLYRGAPARMKEKTSMSFVDRIKELFGKEGDEVDKINVLSERRAALAERRDRLYEQIGTLEEREALLIQQGKENKSTVVRRRLAAQIAQLRKDIARQNTTGKMLNQQINIISTDIHNLTLIQQGQMAALPTAEELTANAVQAEEMLETLRADADLVESLEAGVGDVLTSSDEMDILAEFDEPAKDQAAALDSGKQRATTPAAATTDEEDRIVAEFDDAPDERPSGQKRADPEAS
jgi:hypothetical protein